MAFLGGLFSKFYLVVGATVLLGYLVVETGGYVFSGTDSRPSLSSGRSSSSSGRRGGGGVFFFGSGYRGGK
ncbi:MAG: hypothetical protein RMA76_37570 [Deltaproteobacteria bacterium]|jgi:hypothetical protein